MDELIKHSTKANTSLDGTINPQITQPAENLL